MLASGEKQRETVDMAKAENLQADTVNRGQLDIFVAQVQDQSGVAFLYPDRIEDETDEQFNARIVSHVLTQYRASRTPEEVDWTEFNIQVFERLIRRASSLSRAAVERVVYSQLLMNEQYVQPAANPLIEHRLDVEKVAHRIGKKPWDDVVTTIAAAHRIFAVRDEAVEPEYEHQSPSARLDSLYEQEAVFADGILLRPSELNTMKVLLGLASYPNGYDALEALKRMKLLSTRFTLLTHDSIDEDILLLHAVVEKDDINAYISMSRRMAEANDLPLSYAQKALTESCVRALEKISSTPSEEELAGLSQAHPEVRTKLSTLRTETGARLDELRTNGRIPNKPQYDADSRLFAYQILLRLRVYVEGGNATMLKQNALVKFVQSEINGMIAAWQHSHPDEDASRFGLLARLASRITPKGDGMIRLANDYAEDQDINTLSAQKIVLVSCISALEELLSVQGNV